MFLIRNMRIVNAYELASLRMFLLTKGKWARIQFNVWREVVLNLFRDSRTPLDSIRDKLVTLIYFVIVQCPSVGTTWNSARDLRLPRKTSGFALSADCQTLDVFRIPQQLMIVKIRK